MINDADFHQLQVSEIAFEQVWGLMSNYGDVKVMSNCNDLPCLRGPVRAEARSRYHSISKTRQASSLEVSVEVAELLVLAMVSWQRQLGKIAISSNKTRLGHGIFKALLQWFSSS